METDMAPFWQVDLGQVYPVLNITIFGRTNCKEIIQTYCVLLQESFTTKSFSAWCQPTSNGGRRNDLSLSVIISEDFCFFQKILALDNYWYGSKDEHDVLCCWRMCFILYKSVLRNIWTLGTAKPYSKCATSVLKVITGHINKNKPILFVSIFSFFSIWCFSFNIVFLLLVLFIMFCFFLFLSLFGEKNC